MSFSYSERLNLRLLNLDSLEMRRLRADLILCFKILKGFFDVDASEFVERITSDFVTRGHRYKLVHSSFILVFAVVTTVFMVLQW